MNRRKLLQAAGLGLVTTAIAKPAIAHAQGPIKIGLIQSMTGPFNDTGKAVVEMAYRPIIPACVSCSAPGFAEPEPGAGRRPRSKLMLKTTRPPCIAPLLSLGQWTIKSPSQRVVGLRLVLRCAHKGHRYSGRMLGGSQSVRRANSEYRVRERQKPKWRSSSLSSGAIATVTMIG